MRVCSQNSGSAFLKLPHVGNSFGCKQGRVCCLNHLERWKVGAVSLAMQLGLPAVFSLWKPTVGNPPLRVVEAQAGWRGSLDNWQERSVFPTTEAIPQDETRQLELPALLASLLFPSKSLSERICLAKRKAVYLWVARKPFLPFAVAWRTNSIHN